MRTWLLGLALLFLISPVAAQDAGMTEYTEDTYRARVALGDVPFTPEEEADDVWNVVEYLRFEHDGIDTFVATPTEFMLSCTCVNFTRVADGIQVGSDVEAGFYHIRLVHFGDSRPSIDVDLKLAVAGGTLVAYVPEGHAVHTNAVAQGTLPCTGGAPCDIHTFEIVDGFWMTLQPAGTVQTPTDDDGVLEYIEWIIPFVAGIILWAFLVQRGYVQKRRKQEVQKAAHVEAAETEGKDILAARKRVIMAGLKDLEKAKMNKEVDDASYDKLKAELKREAVVVMRALESAE